MAVPDAMHVSAEDLAAAMRVINAARATPSGSAMAHNTGHQMHQQPQMQQQFFPEEPASEPGFAMSPAQSALMALAAGPSGDLGGALHAGVLFHGFVRARCWDLSGTSLQWLGLSCLTRGGCRSHSRTPHLSTLQTGNRRRDHDPSHQQRRQHAVRSHPR